MTWQHPFAELIVREDETTALTVVPAVPTAPDALRAMFSQFPTGIAAICAEHDGVAQGMVATSFTVGASFDPPLVIFSAQRESRTWPVLAAAPRLGISVLAEANRDAVYRIASRSGDRFADLALARSDDGAVFLAGARLWLDCAIRDTLTLGDHVLVILEVIGASSLADAEPLVYHDGRVV